MVRVHFGLFDMTYWSLYFKWFLPKNNPNQKKKR